MSSLLAAGLGGCGRVEVLLDGQSSRGGKCFDTVEVNLGIVAEGHIRSLTQQPS
jgi:hypothetical protein